MSFNSVTFLLCLPVVILVYWLLPHRFRWIMLLIASYLFYMSWNAWLIFLILFTTAVSYASGLLMDKYDNKKIKTACMVVTLVCCLGVLFFFKYFTFIVNLAIDAINLASPLELGEFTFSLLLPVGISFYTFQTLSYVIDVYRGKIRAERHVGYYALFVIYFPQLVAGPIERPENLLPQLKTARKFTSDDLFVGMRIALIGYLKKIVIADGVAAFVNAVYNNVGAANGLTVLLATVLFAVQIYCDFSGYTDIAIGVARMMGIKLCDNFDRPYLATSIRDFWRRWHISLTSWFTDYVYIPMGGSRCSFVRWAFNVMVVFLLSGLWHGAALTFLVWGGIHGVYQIVGKGKRLLLEKGKARGQLQWVKDNAPVTWLKRAATFALVCFAWIFFRGNSLSDCGVLIGKLFSDWSGSSAALSAMDMTFLSALGLALLCAILPMCHYVRTCDGSAAIASNGTARVVAYAYTVLAVVVAWLALTVSGGESAFIYFQF